MTEISGGMWGVFASDADEGAVPIVAFRQYHAAHTWIANHHEEYGCDLVLLELKIIKAEARTSSER